MCDTLEEDVWSVGVCKEMHHIQSVTVSYCTVLYIKDLFNLFKNIGRNILVLFMFFSTYAVVFACWNTVLKYSGSVSC